MNGRQTELPALNTIIVDFSRSAFLSPFHNLLKKKIHIPVKGVK